VVGDEICMLVDFEGMTDYAQREAEAPPTAPPVQ
jgi:hypothetical protein